MRRLEINKNGISSNKIETCLIMNMIWWAFVGGNKLKEEASGGYCEFSG